MVFGLTHILKEDTMKRIRVLIVVTVLLIGTALVWAQSGNEHAGVLAGYASGNSSGQISGSGMYSVQSGWNLPASGEMLAFLPEDAYQGIATGYSATILFNGGPTSGMWGGTAIKDVPPGNYKVALDVVLTRQSDGATERAGSNFLTAQVGGTKPKVNYGEIKVTTGPTVKNGTMTASGSFKTNPGWDYLGGSFLITASPVTFFLGNDDPSRKTLTGAVAVNLVNNPKTWDATIPGMKSGKYSVLIRFVAADTFDNKNRKIVVGTFDVSAP